MFILGIGYDGLGTGQTPGSAATIYAWGAQLEAQTAASSYVPTTAAAASRSADVLTLNAPNGTYNVRYTFDDLSTQTISTTVSGGALTVPTNLNRSWLRKVESL
jgi:hypothetical protein